MERRRTDGCESDIVCVAKAPASRSRARIVPPPAPHAARTGVVTLIAMHDLSFSVVFLKVDRRAKTGLKFAISARKYWLRGLEADMPEWLAA
jgi:hypothetical protein